MSKKKVIEKNDIKSKLITKGDFKEISKLEIENLKSPGFYCIRLKKNKELPSIYQNVLKQRKHKYIYIGKAEKSNLKKRLKQELYGKGAGTFFRSLGCVLGYLPIAGHLKGKSNQNNFKFSKENIVHIVKRLEEILEISIVKYNGDFSIEKKLIKEYCPLLNIQHNPERVQELEENRANCRRIAKGE